ncbi:MULTISPECIES: DUF1963 domain-containing protein [Stenotrophomonas]|uniref:DUF1963 domain-containing protein n=1 Tax=Stenotrophomonas TaxID=40323 RepID=UPI000D39A3D3|nr:MULTISPECIES: DUF1963 domain-containing protein [Stenotrophomonas]PTS71987.1 DUF1963 domain-containing protein [Stenotrophomonas sp. HMWF023]PTT55928.1 DUF1963 domain-containing protein [Stenotrophomonas sp. HMWF022]CAH0142608.1 hypothetical protein SRABI66_00505 [Stenotrophomonas lactitubi]CAH0189632.1 hypothetical protein SRABI102_01476 [Stenotrophomonas lactitubi]
MYREMVFGDRCQAPDRAFLGGAPYLPADAQWPSDATGKPMLHLASLPAPFVQAHAPKIAIKANLCVSIFTPYDVRDDAYIETAIQAGGRVIAYVPHALGARSAALPFDPCLINTDAASIPDDAQNGIAKIGGIPTWLQDDCSEGREFILQINSSRLNRAAPTHRGILVGGMGYLLLERNIPAPSMDCGRFVIQTT